MNGRTEMKSSICGVISHSGPNGEPLACAYAPEHDGPHSWATLPTFRRRSTQEALAVGAENARDLSEALASTGDAQRSTLVLR